MEFLNTLNLQETFKEVKIAQPIFCERCIARVKQSLLKFLETGKYSDEEVKRILESDLKVLVQTAFVKKGG